MPFFCCFSLVNRKEYQSMHFFFLVTGSLQEKKVLDKAYRNMRELETTSSSSTQFISIPTAVEEPVNIFIHFQSSSSLQLGRDITLSTEVFNHSGREKTIHLVLGIQALHYNGVPIAQLWKEEFHFDLQSDSGKDSPGFRARKFL